MVHAATRAVLLAGILCGPDRAAATQIHDTRPGAESEASAGDVEGPNAEDSYDPRGRRDPFLRPSPRGRSNPVVAARPRGLAGIAVEEVILRGLVRLDDTGFAIVETDRGRSHAMREGQELFDGYVQSVTAGGVVIVVDGPGGAARVVRLTLRSSSGER